MGLKVYGLPLSTNTVRVVAALNEKGLEYELVPIDLRTGAHKQPSFLALNPFGQIPVLEDEDIVLFESRAINRYIVSKCKETGPDLLRSGAGAKETAALEVWLEVESQHFGPPIADLVFEILIKPLFGGATDPATVEKHAEKLGKVLDVYEAHLSKNKYLAGGEFTLADLNHMPYTHYLMKTPKADLVTARPHVLAWWQEVSARPAWKKTAAGIPL
ncbi:glutathione S-transferase 3 [Phoenix dactylifera]|uniref:glutathione transferase n=1 Tax=Phoenix dactylifera TaxID=42345 RepID=A0A8B7C1W8_PHODC|nr:glutathione S-transferase 3 [Phoenix dactylifera]